MANTLPQTFSKNIYSNGYYCILIHISSKFVLKGLTIRLNSVNGLASNRRQTIIGTNDGLIYWLIYASLQLNEFMENTLDCRSHIQMEHWPWINICCSRFMPMFNECRLGVDHIVLVIWQRPYLAGFRWSIRCYGPTNCRLSYHVGSNMYLYWPITAHNNMDTKIGYDVFQHQWLWHINFNLCCDHMANALVKHINID